MDSTRVAFTAMLLRQLQALHLFVAQFFHRGAQLLHPHQAQRQNDHQGQHGHPGQQADLLGNGQPVEPLGGMRGVFRHVALSLLVVGRFIRVTHSLTCAPARSGPDDFVKQPKPR